MPKLDHAAVGSCVTVDELLSTGMLRERMLALGLTKGTRIEVVRKGPFGDPTVYNIRGAMIALRKEEAFLISIYPMEEVFPKKESYVKIEDIPGGS
ncbi:FeoA family protein [Anaerosacchariphilus polymeriproducens]|uniref:Ferrous iron transport protein A n=1 Tax=Anaerosacchariphilus polymeriproducens TaxID=1812858 RepID=A0A371AST7_9FIRM|nr:FeoA family protein [Anaerosacchariphilus polymeriproducens]RDU22637.1 ferrous iron transport protein A [Anaerosacchariphilus polymeriproducens]